ncbi:hypothetical protein HZI73_21685 [Vallitalea pronyensis]|uniref:Uncharacterized protein n=1 Tax=Vallitalea pronyensis TaxID=1348613 RepID=A0A8J8MNE6_9FIRM|nr:hypothetical protein [Vallitalea pronyensis]QUI24751.1 hypothetical protein HZI73_21685 [Vallitalea pronyensis]
MEAIINKIISIENKAREVLDATDKEKQQKQQDMLSRAEALKEKILHDANRKVKQLRERELNEARAKAESHQAETREQLEQMKALVHAHRKQWKDELVNTVLER